MFTNDGKTYSCGGSIIDDRTVLTAAHCTKGSKITHVTVGMHYMSTDIEGQEDIPVERVIDHPTYNLNSRTDNDFAIIVLARAVQWREEVQPICLPTDTTATYLNRMVSIC